MGTAKTNFIKRAWISSNLREAFINGIEIDEEKFISAFCFDNNSQRKTCLEFIKMYEIQKYLKRENGKLIAGEKVL